MNTAKPGLSFGKKLAIFLTVVVVVDVVGFVFLAIHFPSFWHEHIANKIEVPDEDWLRQCDDEIRKNPNNAQNYVTRAEVHQDLLQDKLALADYNKAISLDGGHADWYDARGQLTPGSAIADFSMAIKLDPDHGEYYVDRAQEYSAEKREREALADFQKALDKNVDASVVLSSRGEMHQDFGEVEDAFADYKQFLAVIENDNDKLSDVCERLAKIYIARGDYDNALSVASRWAKDEYSRDDACTMQGRIFELQGRKSMADEQYRAAIAALESLPSPLSSYLIEKRGDLNLRLGNRTAAKSDWQKAIVAVESSLQMNSEDYELDHGAMGDLYEKLGDPAKRDASYRLCIKYLDGEISKDANGSDNYEKRAEYFIDLADYPSALRDLQNAKHIAPESAAAYDGEMARILLKEKKTAEALTAYLAVPRKDADAAIDVGLAQALELSGRHAEALAAADRAINANGEFDACYKWRAKACQSLGDKKGAATGFKIAAIFRGQ
jgi:tetratricopeptide (TPR) repeat protein